MIHGDLEGLHVDLVQALKRLELRLYSDLIVTSGVREDSPAHATGLAADISCEDSVTRFLLVDMAMKLGFERIGVYDRHVHLDLCKGEFPQLVLWTGTSR